MALDVAALRPVYAGRPVIVAGPALVGGGALVHGLGELDAGPVLASGVAVLRPVEHVTVRADEEPQLRVVGAELGERVGYRGIVTIDGVLTAAGFRPTECNPRWWAAIGYLEVALPELPLIPLHHAVAADAVADLPVDGPQPGDLLGVVIAHRTGRARRRGSGCSTSRHMRGSPTPATTRRYGGPSRPTIAGDASTSGRLGPRRRRRTWQIGIQQIPEVRYRRFLQLLRTRSRPTAPNDRRRGGTADLAEWEPQR